MMKPELSIVTLASIFLSIWIAVISMLAYSPELNLFGFSILSGILCAFGASILVRGFRVFSIFGNLPCAMISVMTAFSAITCLFSEPPPYVTPMMLAGIMMFSTVSICSTIFFSLAFSIRGDRFMNFSDKIIDMQTRM